jgi:hypothetical protein
VVLLNFWATWCGPCTIEIPWFEEFEQQYRSRGFEVLGVSMDEDGWKAIKPFAAEHKVNYRILLATIPSASSTAVSIRCRQRLSSIARASLRLLLTLVLRKRMTTLKRFRHCWASSKHVLRGWAFLISLPFFLVAETGRLTVLPPQQLSVKRGASVTQALKVSIMPGFHVNSDKPKDEFLIPLKLTWEPGALDFKTVSYPHPEEIQVGKDLLSVFTGEVELQTHFVVRDDAPVGQTFVNGKLRYQACNNLMCFKPATVDVRLPVSIQ